jgi:transcriptional regulator with XRE-family HTH domain
MNNNRDIDFIQQFGKNLRKIRKDRNVSQETLAINADTSRSQVARIERGIVNPTITTVNKFAEALQIDIQCLFQFDV